MSAKASEVEKLCDGHLFPWAKPTPNYAVPAATQPLVAITERDGTPFSWSKSSPIEQSPYCSHENFFDHEEPLLPSVGAGFEKLFARAIERDRRTSATRKYEFDLVYRLSRDAMLPLAAQSYFETLQLIRRYFELDERDRRIDAVDAYVASLPALAEPVSQQIERDKTTEAAIELVALETGVPVQTVMVYWKKKAKLMRKAARDKRNRQIMRMVARGWTDAAIAKRVDMHPKSIRRIIKQQRAAW